MNDYLIAIQNAVEDALLLEELGKKPAYSPKNNEDLEHAIDEENRLRKLEALCIAFFKDVTANFLKDNSHVLHQIELERQIKEVLQEGDNHGKE